MPAELGTTDAIVRVLRDLPQGKFLTMQELVGEIGKHFPYLDLVSHELRSAVEQTLSGGRVVLAVREGNEYPDVTVALAENVTDDRPRISVMLLKLTETRTLTAAPH